MKATPSTAWPVRALHEIAETLKEAIEACLRSPGVEHVHRLRTTTRRVEGQLVLLKAIPSAPRLKHTGKLRRELKRLRQEASAVHDLDVLLKHVACIRPNIKTAAWKQEQTRLHDALRSERVKEARTLLHLLQRRGHKVKRLLDDLLKQLEHQGTLRVEPAALAALARDWFLERVKRAAKNNDITRLHDIRKAAKLSRYMGENAGGRSSNPASRLVAKMKNLQDAGGRWHDCLTLVEAAAMRLGKSSALPSHFAKRRDALRSRYESKLRRIME